MRWLDGIADWMDMNLSKLCQGVFWASLAIASLARPPTPVRPTDAKSPDHGRLDLRSTLWRYALAVGCGAIGKVWASFPA